MPKYGSLTDQRNTPFSKLLDTNGDGTGSTNANGDYSSTGDEFLFTSPTDTWTVVQRMLVKIEDTTGFTVEEYGNLGSALTTGITITIEDDNGTEKVDFTPVSIKTNGDWAGYCYDGTLSTFGAGNEYYLVRWTFSKFHPLGVVLPPGWQIIATMGGGGGANDNMSDLVTHQFCIQGYQDTDLW